MKKSIAIVLSVLMLFMLMPAMVFAEGNITEIGPGESIQDAVIAASAGDTILVAPGTYHEANLMIGTERITLKSTDGAKNTIIDATGSDSYGIGIYADNVVVEGFTVRNWGSEDNSGSNRSGITVAEKVAGAVVKNNIVEGNIDQDKQSNGIQIRHNEGLTTVEGNTITGIRYTQGGEELEKWAGTGIGVWGSSNIVINNNIILGTQIGIGVNGQSTGYVTKNVTVTSNKIEGANPSAVQVMALYGEIDIDTILFTGNTVGSDNWWILEVNLKYNDATQADYNEEIDGKKFLYANAFISNNTIANKDFRGVEIWYNPEQNTDPWYFNVSYIDDNIELPYSEEGPDAITLEQGESVTLTVGEDNQEEINAVIPIEFLQYLLDNKLDIIIDTPYGTLNIPAELLAVLGSDVELKFAFSSSVDSTVLAIEELAGLMSEAGISENLEGKNAVAIGLPINITSTISDVGGTITIPLADADYDEAVTYYIFVEHSDGAEEVITGEVVDFGDGKGIQFIVDYFSTFTIFALEDEVPEETTETTTTTETSQDETTAETTAPEQTSEQSDATTEPTDMVQESVPKTGESTPYVPYLVFLGLGLIFAVSLKIRMYVRQKSNK